MDIVDRLKSHCDAHPVSHILWPCSFMHDAIAEIERLRLKNDAIAKIVHEWGDGGLDDNESMGMIADIIDGMVSPESSLAIWKTVPEAPESPTAPPDDIRQPKSAQRAPERS
jgi:hypothetical protein